MTDEGASLMHQCIFNPPLLNPLIYSVLACNYTLPTFEYILFCLIIHAY